MLSSPSSAIMASDSRRPYSIGIEGVYGKYPVAFALIMSPKSKKTRGHLACSRAASALGLAQTSPSPAGDRKSTRLNSSHGYISYAVFCLKKKNDRIMWHVQDRGERHLPRNVPLC